MSAWQQTTTHHTAEDHNTSGTKVHAAAGVLDTTYSMSLRKDANIPKSAECNTFVHLSLGRSSWSLAGRELGNFQINGRKPWIALPRH